MKLFHFNDQNQLITTIVSYDSLVSQGYYDSIDAAKTNRTESLAYKLRELNEEYSTKEKELTRQINLIRSF